MQQLVTLMLTALSRFNSLRQKLTAKSNCSGELRKSHDIPGCSRADYINRKKGKRKGEDQGERMGLKWEREQKE